MTVMKTDSILGSIYAGQSSVSYPPSGIKSWSNTLIDSFSRRSLSRPDGQTKHATKSQVAPVNMPNSTDMVENDAKVLPLVITQRSDWNVPSSLSTIKTNDKTENAEKKKCFTPVWKNRLQGLLVGLAIALLMTATALAIALTRPWEKPVTTTVTATATTATVTTSSCNSFQWNSSGVIVAGNGTGGSAPNQLRLPYGVYVDSNNNIYAADSGNHRIQKWLPNAASGATVVGMTGVCMTNTSGLCSPRTIYGDDQQNLYIGSNDGIFVWPMGSTVGTLINGSSTVNGIYGVFLDRYRNVYASESRNQAIIMWNTTASGGMTVAGGNGRGFSSSQLYNPYGLTVDASTNTIYVANSDAHTIVAWQRGAATGTPIIGQNSTYGATNLLLRLPRDVKRDSFGNMYVLDSDNNRVLLICADSSSTSPRSIIDADFRSPRSIALDAQLNIYVADYNNHRILKFNRVT